MLLRFSAWTRAVTAPLSSPRSRGITNHFPNPLLSVVIEYVRFGRKNGLETLDSLKPDIIILIISLYESVIPMVKLKIRAIGTSAGVILPKETLAHMGVHEGDELFLVEGPDGYQVTPYDPSFEKQLESARKGMDTYRNTLRELAK